MIVEQQSATAKLEIMALTGKSRSILPIALSSIPSLILIVSDLRSNNCERQIAVPGLPFLPARKPCARALQSAFEEMPVFLVPRVLDVLTPGMPHLISLLKWGCTLSAS